MLISYSSSIPRRRTFGFVQNRVFAFVNPVTDKRASFLFFGQGFASVASASNLQRWVTLVNIVYFSVTLSSFAYNRAPFRILRRGIIRVTLCNRISLYILRRDIICVILCIIIQLFVYFVEVSMTATSHKHREVK